MSRMITRAAVAVALLGTAACTQRAAEVELKGQNAYGHNGATYAAKTSNPSYASWVQPSAPAVSTAQSAAVAPIAVSNLSAPEKNATLAKESDGNDTPTQRINPWTGKPRSEYSDIAAKETRPVTLARDQSSFIWPVSGNKIVSGYGPKGGGKVNDGINIAAAEGEPVWAAADGEVVYVGNELSGYGNMVLIKHAGSKTTTYAHLSQSTVDKYDRVKQGDIIGYVGSTGNVKDPQLHFAVRDGKEAVDPQKYVSRSMAGL